METKLNQAQHQAHLADQQCIRMVCSESDVAVDEIMLLRTGRRYATCVSQRSIGHESRSVVVVQTPQKL